MSKTLRRGGWGNPIYQHINYYDVPAGEWRNPLYRYWKYRKIYDEHWTCSPTSKQKKLDNRIDRRRWNREAKKEEPQLTNHRHRGLWAWW